MACESKTDIILERRNLADVEGVLGSRGVKLFSHQRDGVAWMLTREREGVLGLRGGFMCDDPGLGKTFQTIATIVGNKVEHTLVIVPKSVIGQWKDAFEKLVPEMEVYVHHGPDVASRERGGVEELERRRGAVTITTLGKVLGRAKKGQLEIEKTLLHDVDWGRIVIDESQEIRNKKSKRNKAVTALCGELRWCLSGTPVQNKASDMLAQYKFLGLDELPESLLERVNNIFLKRRTKFEVAKQDENFQIPILRQTIHALEFSTPEERRMYNLIRKNVSEDYKTLMGSSRPDGEKMVQIFELLLRLKQASSNIQLVMDGYERKFGVKLDKYEGGSTKMSWLVDELSKLEGKENSLVFCQFTEEMKMIGGMLDERGIMWDKYDGSLSTDRREQVMSRFIDMDNDTRSDLIKELEPKSPNVLLVQIKAGGVGLNLQQFTQVFITTADWNPSNEIQAIARAHRMGQRKAVEVHRMSLHDNMGEFDTIDERIFNIQGIKRRLMSDILKEDSALDMGLLDTSKVARESLAKKLSINDAENLLA